MTPSPLVGADGALDSLVSQFSSSLDCFRELVQNSIDAGSHQVDVWLEHSPGAGGAGATAIHVDDFGEGMDEAIIDSQLTQLFASAKEDDLTKIGKFGIGFVSVFALQPRGVLVHTGRGGEFWEVFFHADRSFTKTRIDGPIEGTQVTLYLEQSLAEYHDLVTAARKTLKRWCVHSETDIFFEDRSAADSPGPERINEPFTVGGDCAAEVLHQGTHIAIAFHRQPSYAFYNRGLTLFTTQDAEEALGTAAEEFTGITFKIKSRYLEHTLSRETILRDANYEKAVELLRQAVHGELRSNLPVRLAELAAHASLDSAGAQQYFFLLAMLYRHYVASPHRQSSFSSSLMQVPMLRSFQGAPVSLEQMQRSYRLEGRAYYASHHSPVVGALLARGCPVLLGPPRNANNPLRDLLGATLGGALSLEAAVRQHVVDPHEVFFGLQLDPAPQSSAAKLINGAAALLEAVGAGYDDVRACALSSGQAGTPLLLVSDQFRDTMSIPRGPVLHTHSVSRRVVAINQDHPEVHELVEDFHRFGALAVYCLAKRVLLADGRRLELDGPLMTEAMASFGEVER